VDGVLNYSRIDSITDKTNLLYNYYGTINGQPTSLTRNDESYGNVSFSVDFWETITEISPVKRTSVKDVLRVKSASLVDNSARIYASKSKPEPVNVSEVKFTSEKNFSLIDKVAELKEVGSEKTSAFKLKKNKSLNSLDKLIEEPFEVLKSINGVLFSAYDFDISKDIKLGLYGEMYEEIKNLLLLNSDKSTKAYFEAVEAVILISLANSLTNPIEGDFLSRSDVLSSAQFLNDLYQDYLLTLDNIQVGFDSVENSFFASAEVQNDLQDIVLRSLDSLYDLAFESKQERTVVLDSDTDLFLLVHKYIGLDSEDLNLEKFRQLNKIKYKKLFLVKKGTSVKYLV
jgi:hypothetical protein